MSGHYRDNGPFAYADVRLLIGKQVDIVHFHFSLGTLVAIILAATGIVPYSYFLGFCVAYQIVGAKARAGIREGWRYISTCNMSAPPPPHPHPHHIYIIYAQTEPGLMTVCNFHLSLTVSIRRAFCAVQLRTECSKL